MIPERVAAYREEFRRAAVPRLYHGWIHFAFMAALCAGLVLLLLARVEAPSLPELLTVPATFLYANFVEYWAHRGPLHRPIRGLGLLFRVHAGKHHRFFTDEAMGGESHRDFCITLFSPLTFAFFLGGFALPVAGALHFLASPNAGSLMLATSIAYFLNYEALHLAYHLPDGHWIRRVPGIERLRAHHLAHHDPRWMHKLHFNVTYPIADRFFGTFRRPSA